MAETTAAAPVLPVAKEAESGKPTKTIPTDRAGFVRQLDVLKAYGALAVEQGVTATTIAEALKVHMSTVSVCTPFFADSGLLERAGGGYKAVSAVVSYHKATEWSEGADTAAHKLAPILREAWYWRPFKGPLTFRPIDESEAIRLLAEESGAGPSYRTQLKFILDYLVIAGLMTRDGSQLRRGPTFSGEAQTPAPLHRDAPLKEALPAPERPEAMTPGIVFDASIRVTEKEIGSWSPEQIREFFAGLAAVISAKARAGVS